MINLRKALTAYLKNIHSRVYFQSAPGKVAYPYIVFDIPNYIDDGEFQEFMVVDVDGWDSPMNGDTSGLETLMESINALNKTTLMTDDLAVSFYLDLKLPLIDPDPLIKRRKYVYQARLYKRE
ncbi:hypothetical protein [Neobacillus sp. FSL H8-0543]|uniref:hypothetical protein n=1 Tax=Neobacillus sp. FSL H8-0543 TaxID=2954672 RepID=UPI0031580CC0